MANGHRGEVALRAGDKTYVLRLSFNALAEIEDALGQPFPALAQRFERGEAGIREIRAVLWAALRSEQPNISLEEAGDIVDEAGFPAVMEALQESFRRAFPQSRGKTGNGRREATSGTGTAS